jgi:hypothetical protein
VTQRFRGNMRGLIARSQVRQQYHRWVVSYPIVYPIRLDFVANALGAQLYLQRVGPNGALGAPQLLHRADHLGSTILSCGAELVAFYQPVRRGSMASSILVLETTSGASLGAVRDGEESHVVPIAFCPLAGDPRFLATSDRTGQTRPLICDPRTGERAELQLDALDGDVIPLDWSEDGRALLLCH